MLASDHRLKAFNLMEVLLVLALMGILILLALPNHSSTIAKAKAMEAKSELRNVHSLQKMYFYEHSKYATSLDKIGFEQNKLSDDGGQANYLISLSSSDNSGYIAKAVSIVDFDGDGDYNEWQIDQDKNLQEVVAD